MKINIIKRKASSYKYLSTIQMEVGNPAHLLELLHIINHYKIKEVFQK